MAHPHPLSFYSTIPGRNHHLQHGVSDGMIRGRGALSGLIDEHAQSVPHLLRGNPGRLPTCSGGIYVQMTQVDGNILHTWMGDELKQRP